MTKEDIKARLIQNDALFNNIYVVEQQFDILPDDRIHYGAAITYQELICKGWFLPPNTYDCGSFVVNGTAVVRKE